MFKNSDGIPTEKLPIEERYSARFFELKDIFSSLEVHEDNIMTPSFFHNVSSWREYVQYLSSPDSALIERPSKEIMGYQEFNSIGRDRDD